MENSYRFFANRDCKYYPCHKGIEEMNCLFCFCPFYLREDCPGNPNYIETADGVIKDCTNCCFPHRAENYDEIIRWLKNQKCQKPDGILSQQKKDTDYNEEKIRQQQQQQQQ